MKLVSDVVPLEAAKSWAVASDVWFSQRGRTNTAFRMIEDKSYESVLKDVAGRIGAGSSMIMRPLSSDVVWTRNWGHE